MKARCVRIEKVGKSAIEKKKKRVSEGVCDDELRLTGLVANRSNPDLQENVCLVSTPSLGNCTWDDCRSRTVQVLSLV